MISAIREVCSRVPDNCGMKPFFISCSIKLLERRKAKIEFLRVDLNILSGRTISLVGGLLKISVSSVLNAEKQNIIPLCYGQAHNQGASGS